MAKNGVNNFELKHTLGIYYMKLQMAQSTHLCIKCLIKYQENVWDVISFDNDGDPEVNFTSGLKTGKTIHTYV